MSEYSSHLKHQLNLFKDPLEDPREIGNLFVKNNTLVNYQHLLVSSLELRLVYRTQENPLSVTRASSETLLK
jgi:hypothetical protein